MRSKRSLQGSVVITLILVVILFLLPQQKAHGGGREFPPTTGEWVEVVKGMEYKLIPTGDFVECSVVLKKGRITLRAIHKWHLYGTVLHEVKIDKKGRIISDWSYVLDENRRIGMQEFFPIFVGNCYKFVKDLPEGIKAKMEAYGVIYNVYAPIKSERYVEYHTP